MSSWKELFGLIVNLFFLLAPKPKDDEIDEELVSAQIMCDHRRLCNSAKMCNCNRLQPAQTVT